MLFLIALFWRIAYLFRLEGAALLSNVLRADELVYWDWATYLMAHDFQGSNPFFFGPLYPYALALVRSLVGSDVFRVLIVQAVWGSAAAVLIADAARRLVGWRIGLAAGLLYALYEMNVFFDGLVLMESLVLFLEALLLWLWTRTAQRGGGIGWQVAIGAVIGLATLGRATGALFLLPALWIAKRRDGEMWRPAAARMAALSVAFLATVSPGAIHNWNVTGEFIPFTYNFGMNFYIGNHENATGRYIWVAGAQGLGAVKGQKPDGGIDSDGRQFLEATEGVALSPRQSSDLWTRKALEWAKGHPLEVLGLAGSKILLLWNMREQFQIESAEMHRRRAGPLGLPWVGSFLFVGVLGVVGLVHAGAHRTIGPALRMYVASFVLGMLPFFVTDRYRVHMVPALILLAAVAVHAWWVRRPRSGNALRFALPAALATGLALVPITHPTGRLNELMEALDMGSRWLDRGRPDMAVAEYEKAVAADASISGIEHVLEQDLRGAMFFNYAYSLRATGRPEEAMTWFRRAAEVAPQNPKFLRTLGDALRARGDIRASDSLLTEAAGLMGSTTEIWISRGYEAAREGRHAEAESLFAEATRLSMRHYGAWGALIRIQVQQQALGRARKTVEAFKRTSAPPHMVSLYDAFVLAASGEAARAKAILAQLPPPEAGDDPILGWVRSTTEKMIAAGGG